jgi:hypothetical protein
VSTVIKINAVKSHIPIQIHEKWNVKRYYELIGVLYFYVVVLKIIRV